MARSSIVEVEVPVALLRWLKAEAKANERNLAGQIRFMLRHLQEHVQDDPAKLDDQEGETWRELDE